MLLQLFLRIQKLRYRTRIIHVDIKSAVDFSFLITIVPNYVFNFSFFFLSQLINVLSEEKIVLFYQQIKRHSLYLSMLFDPRRKGGSWILGSLSSFSS